MDAAGSASVVLTGRIFIVIPIDAYGVVWVIRERPSSGDEPARGSTNPDPAQTPALQGQFAAALLRRFGTRACTSETSSRSAVSGRPASSQRAHTVSE